MGSRRTLAAIMIIIVAASVTGMSAYGLMNTQQSNQQNYILGLLLFQIGQPRIVSCAPNIDEILYGLDLEDYIIGCTDHDPYGLGYLIGDYYYPPKIIELIVAGQIDNSINWWYPSVEDVVTLNPTIVLLDSGVSNQIAMYPTLVSQGIFTFLVPQGERISEIELSILQIGSLFKRSLMAQALVDAMQTKIITVNDTVSQQEVVNVLICVWIDFDQNTIYTCGNNTFISEIVQKAGGLNIYYDSSIPWPILTISEAATRNPDKIVILDHNLYLDPTETLINIGNSLLSTTNAWSNGEIYFVQGQAENLFSRPGPRVAEGVELLANILFPSLFNATFDYPHVLNTNNYMDYLTSVILE